MRIIARDANMIAISEIDMYTSFIWTDRYSDAGDFELRVPCTDEYYELFKQTVYITIDKSDRVMVIEKRQVSTRVDNADEYIITGRSADTLLDRRVIMGTLTFGTAPYDEQTNSQASQNYAVDDYLIWYGALYRVIVSIVSGATFVAYDGNKQNIASANIIAVTDSDEHGYLTTPIETIVATMLNTTVINPTDPTRRFANPAWRYIYSDDNRIKEIKMAASFANTNLYDALSSLLVGAGLGCKVVYNDETETMDFSLIIGTDHSVSQSENMVINFKNVLDNIISTDFTSDETTYKTCAYVVGAMDEKKTRTLSYADELGRTQTVDYENPNYCTTWCQQVSLAGTGMSYQRREVIVDASDIDRYQTVNDSSGYSTSDVAVSESDYRSLLKTRGKNELMDMASTYDLEAEILPDMFYKYMIDYTLGDTISIEDRFGNTINASVTEMIYYVDVNGYKAYPTIETIGAVDGIDQLVNIFVNHPIYINSDNCMVVPDIREELQDLRSKTFIAHYVANIIDYLLDGHLISVTSDGEVAGGYKIICPSMNDMDQIVLGATVPTIYANPGQFGDLSTRAIQFVSYMMNNQIQVTTNDVIVPSFDDLASSIQ